MTKKRVFYSFHYDNDYWRVQQVRNMGVVDGDKPVECNKWEEIKKQGDIAIKKWIDDSLKNCSCLVVLIGSKTAERKWVKYEIEKAWELGKGVLGIRIHNLGDRNGQCCVSGENPFYNIDIWNGYSYKSLSTIVQCYNPDSYAPYNDIKNRLPLLVEQAIEIRKRH